MYTKEEIQIYWNKCEQVTGLLKIINYLLDDEYYTKENAAKDLMKYLDFSELDELRIRDRKNSF